MRSNLTLICVLTGLATALFAAVTALGAVYGVIPAVVCGAVMTLVCVWVFAGCILREKLYCFVQRRFDLKDYHGAKAALERAAHNHLFYPLYRSTRSELLLKTELALDDIAAAAKEVDKLRHAGGDGWKYRTAYYVVLFDLDWGELDAARAEYDAFYAACAHSQIYREELTALGALIALAGGEKPTLPDCVKNSPYPVVHRIVEKY